MNTIDQINLKKETFDSLWHYAVLLTMLMTVLLAAALTGEAKTLKEKEVKINYNTVKIDELDIFYREAGDKSKPTILLLHGFPASSFMFRNLIPQLADKFHVIAPDYPGFGQSSMPSVNEFNYTFDHLSEIIDKFTQSVGISQYSLYVQDYGAPVGYRLAVKHPERVQGLIIQNGNAYVEGLSDFWVTLKSYWQEPTAETTAKLREVFNIDTTKWQYTHGTRHPELITPDTWTLDQARLDRPGNQEIQLKLFFDYGSNPPLYPKWQAYFRQYQPPTLIVWGKNDQIFPASGAEPYKRDLKNIEFNLLDTGHFALEEDLDFVAARIKSFLGKNIKK